MTLKFVETGKVSEEGERYLQAAGLTVDQVVFNRKKSLKKTVFKVDAKPKLNVDLPMSKGDFDNSDRKITSTSPPRKVATKKERNASIDNDAKPVKRS